MENENIWKQLTDKVNENQERWKEIDALYNELKHNVGGYEQSIRPIISLLLLLTEQLRPMSDAGKETGKLMDDISGFMGKLGIKV